jgi:hypothetical protein
MLMLLVGLSAAAGPLQARAEPDRWAAFRFLIGEWVGEGSGQPGKGSGEFSLAFDLREKVLVRRNRNDIPAAAGRPAVHHEDLMVIYSRRDGDRAIYFDNEGHVIEYSVIATPDNKSLIFLSEPLPSVPRFRLTYTPGETDQVRIKFDIAPPGKPDAFKTYLEGSARKKK